jgi:hypothetical protein
MKGNSDALENLEGDRAVSPVVQESEGGNSAQKLSHCSRNRTVAPATMKGNSHAEESLKAFERCLFAVQTEGGDSAPKPSNRSRRSTIFTHIRGLEALVRSERGVVFTRKVCRPNIPICVSSGRLEEETGPAQNGFRLCSCDSLQKETTAGSISR